MAKVRKIQKKFPPAIVFEEVQRVGVYG